MYRVQAVADSVSPLLKDVGVPHAILVKLATNCTKQQILFGAVTKRPWEEMQSFTNFFLHYAGLSTIVGSYSLLKKLAGCQFLFVSRMQNRQQICIRTPTIARNAAHLLKHSWENINFLFKHYNFSYSSILNLFIHTSFRPI
jgi:hypothetical protein